VTSGDRAKETGCRARHAVPVGGPVQGQCRTGPGIGALVPACLLIGRLTFVVFPDSYKTSPKGTMVVLPGRVVGVVRDGVAGGARGAGAGGVLG